MGIIVGRINAPSITNVRVRLEFNTISYVISHISRNTHYHRLVSSHTAKGRMKRKRKITNWDYRASYHLSYEGQRFPQRIYLFSYLQINVNSLQWVYYAMGFPLYHNDPFSCPQQFGDKRMLYPI